MHLEGGYRQHLVVQEGGLQRNGSTAAAQWQYSRARVVFWRQYGRTFVAERYQCCSSAAVVRQQQGNSMLMHCSRRFPDDAGAQGSLSSSFFLGGQV